MNRVFAGVALLGAFAIAGAGTWAWLGDNAEGGATSVESIVLGRRLYAEHCASCHGGNLEGKPNWRQRLPTGRIPAPPHDASGHTWHHSDDALFSVTKEGSAAVAGGGYESDMPSFGPVLSDGEIKAVLAFIKSTWPARQRASQEKRNSQERRTAQ